MATVGDAENESQADANDEEDGSSVHGHIPLTNRLYRGVHMPVVSSPRGRKREAALMAEIATRFTVADVEFIDTLVLKREHKGTDWCCNKGVGRSRERLKEGRVDAIKIFGNSRDEALRETRKRARETLAEICHACGGCKWAKL